MTQRDTEGSDEERDARIEATLRRVYDAYSRGDFDETAKAFHPDIELLPAGGQPPIKRDRIRAWMEPDAFEEQALQPVDFRFAGHKVLVRVRARARGTGSGIQLDFYSWGVWTFDADGLATRVEIYLDHQEAQALDAAGAPT